VATRFRLRIAGILLGVYGLIVLLITLTPSPVDRPFASILQRALAELHERGFPNFIGYAQVEFLSNVVMFAPIGFLICLVLPLERWWWAAVLGTGLSVLIELTQLLVLSHRFASVLDVIANGCGALLGASLAWAFRRVVRHRDGLLLEDRRNGLERGPTRPGANELSG
jgi:glycopeptide antibiotics resistance protein